MISEVGEQIIVNIEDALNKAKSIGLDLIEIAPDKAWFVKFRHGKLKYEKKRKKLKIKSNTL